MIDTGAGEATDADTAVDTGERKVTGGVRRTLSIASGPLLVWTYLVKSGHIQPARKGLGLENHASH